MAEKSKTNKNRMAKATVLKSDLGDNVHLEKESGRYYVIFNVRGKEPFFIEFELLDRLATNWREIIRAQGDLKNDKHRE